MTCGFRAARFTPVTELPPSERRQSKERAAHSFTPTLFGRSKSADKTCFFEWAVMSLGCSSGSSNLFSEKGIQPTANACGSASVTAFCVFQQRSNEISIKWLICIEISVIWFGPDRQAIGRGICYSNPYTPGRYRQVSFPLWCPVHAMPAISWLFSIILGVMPI